MNNWMEVADIRKLAIHVQCAPRAKFEAKLRQLISRFPKRISFGV